MSAAQSSPSRRALIVGSGIAGVTSAYALGKAGWDVTVLEQAPDVRKLYVGSGIHLWNNTMRALGELGLADRVAAISGPGAVVEKMQFITPRGRVLATVKCGEMGRRMGGDCVGINRAELLPALAEALDDGIIQTDSQVKSFEQDGDGVTVTLADGRTERGDVLIGADGIRSIVRAAVRGPEGPPRYAGYTIWQGIASVSSDTAPIGIFPLVYGPGLRFAYYRVSDERLYWFGVANAQEGGKDPEGAIKDKLLELYKGWPAPTEEIIGVTDEGVIHRRDLYDRDPVDRWGEGRVTLVGDAAHPMTFDIGQGAGQGIEDALVLGRILGDATDLSQALRDFEQRRMQRTAHMQTLSRRVGIAGRWKHPLAVFARNAITRATLGNPIAVKQFEKDLAYEF
jgi:2-polyprenyl-6-methoxyphenol hydroxylase-like FAD-dependent oxidoreductase